MFYILGIVADHRRGDGSFVLTNKTPALNLSDNKVEDISVVINFKHLVELWLSNNPIKDYSPLANYPKLERVYIAKGDQELFENLRKRFNEKVEVLFKN